MQRLPIIVLATLVLGGTAVAAEQGASSRTPGHEMKSGTSDTTGSRSPTGGSDTGASGTSGTGTHR